MKIAIGSDHRGILQRKVLAEIIESCGHEVNDQGSYDDSPCDYPDIAEKLCATIVDGESDFGILVCGTGIGVSMAANKIPGIRAALVCDVNAAELSKQHNNANVLCLAGNDFKESHYREVVTAWLNAEFEGGRHARRVDKISALEQC